MMKKYFLGIDGGGTKTAFCLIDEDLNVIDTIYSGPTSLDTVDEMVMKANLAKVLELSVDGQIVSCFAGIGGIVSISDQEKVINVLKTFSLLSKAIIKADNDVINALVGGIGKEEGIVCIIGTGSVSYGINQTKSHRCGGYCYQEGDAGSSYDLGKKALQHLARVLDKRIKPSSFSDELMKFINVDSYASLVKYFTTSTRTEIAHLAPIVTQSSDNEYAKAIIDQAVSEIVLMIKTVYYQLGFNSSELAIIGSLGNAKTYYRTRLINLLNSELPNLTLIDNRYSADFGAALKAFYLTK